MEKRNLEQRYTIKFCVKLNENATETSKNKKGLVESMLYQGHRFLGGWHKTFVDGRDSVQDEPRSGRPCT